LHSVPTRRSSDLGETWERDRGSSSRLGLCDWVVIHLCLITGCARSRLSHRVKNTIREKALVDLGQIGWGVYGCRVRVGIGNGSDGRVFRVSDRGVFGGAHEESVAGSGRTLQVQRNVAERA